MVWFLCVFFFFKQKTAYEMRISDWSSDVCSSDLAASTRWPMHQVTTTPEPLRQPSPRCVAPRIRPMSLPWEGFSHKNSRISVHPIPVVHGVAGIEHAEHHREQQQTSGTRRRPLSRDGRACAGMASGRRSEEHTSELQSLMRISYAVF